MQPQQQHETAAWIAVGSKLAPGVIGALIALRWVPTGSTWSDRLWSFVGGCGCAVWAAPALVEWTDIGSARIEAFAGFTSGMLGMVIVGEVVQTVRGLQLAETIRSILAARFGGGSK